MSIALSIASCTFGRSCRRCRVLLVRRRLREVFARREVNLLVRETFFVWATVTNVPNQQATCKEIVPNWYQLRGSWSLK